MNLPNSLTAVRLLLGPVVFWLIVSGHLRAATGVFVVAAATDFFDGWLARIWHLSTRLGELGDPVADKVLLSGTFLAFGWTGAVPFWLVVVVFGRDVYLLVAAVIAIKFTSLTEYRPTLAGKLNTAVQILYVAILLSASLSGDANLHNLQGLLVWPIAILAAWTGLHYTIRGILRLAHH